MTLIEQQDLQGFKDAIDLYSADLSRWPVEKIKPALALLEESAEAKAYFERMNKAEDALRAYVPHAPRLDALEARIMAAIADVPREEPSAPVTDFQGQLEAALAKKTEKTGFKWKPAYIFAPSGGLLAAMVLGFIIGALPHNSTNDFLVDPVYYAQNQTAGTDVDMYSGGFF